MLEDFLSAESEFWQIYADMTQNCDTSGAECWDSCIPFVDRVNIYVIVIIYVSPIGKNMLILM